MSKPTLKITRVAILWEHLTTYMQANLLALLDIPEVTLFAIQRIAGDNVRTPQLKHPRLQVFDLSTEHVAEESLLRRLLEFDPDVAIITGISFSLYRKAASQLSKQGCIVVWASDRIQRNGPSDFYQILRGRLKLWKNYQAAFVPGLAAEKYAKSIGFSPETILQGLYSCNTNVFHPIGEQRHQSQQDEWPRAFLFIGQLIERKGINTLLEAYKIYRDNQLEPWDLYLVGDGPLKPNPNETHDGIKYFGFLLAEEMTELLQISGCFILPSLWDHWGVVIHEATCSGLPVIATNTCGAAVDLVKDGNNGFLFSPGDAKALANCMEQISKKGVARSFGQKSLKLSYKFDPKRFAQTVLVTIPQAIKKS